MKTVKLTSCNNSIDAHYIKHKLEHAGIFCYLTNEFMSNVLPIGQLFGRPTALGFGVHIFVREEDLEQALQIVKDVEKDE